MSTDIIQRLIRIHPSKESTQSVRIWEEIMRIIFSSNTSQLMFLRARSRRSSPKPEIFSLLESSQCSVTQARERELLSIRMPTFSTPTFREPRRVSRSSITTTLSESPVETSKSRSTTGKPRRSRRTNSSTKMTKMCRTTSRPSCKYYQN